MKDYQHQFIQFAIDCEVLRFGDFTLKSGRKSPYFFNTGLFDTGARLARLGSYYAEALIDRGIEVDILYGPAYKGIPLVAATAIALSGKTGKEIPFAFNRKEAKDHGEGGVIVGTPLKGKVLILDDVITAGTSIRESVEIIRAHGAHPAGVLIALDREEKGPAGVLSAVEEVAATYGIQVESLVNLGHVLQFLKEQGHQAAHEEISAYRSNH